MGLRELLILLLILAIVAVVLRGLYVALHSRRNQLRMELTRNVPEYDLEELEFRELPSGGARQVERSFERVMQQNSAYDAAEKAGVGTDIPVLTEAADPEPDFDTEPESGLQNRSGPEADPHPEPEPEPRPEPEPEQAPRREAATDFGEDEHDALDGHVFVEDYDSEYDDEDYDDDLDDQEDDDDELDEELDDALSELLDEEGEKPPPASRTPEAPRREVEPSRYTDLAADADWLDDDGEEPFDEEHETDPEPDVFGDDGYEIEELTLSGEESPPMDEPRLAAASAQPESEPEPEPEPAPGPEESPEPISARDDFDILLDGYEEERAQRMEELENRQDTASRRFMQWAGERVGRAGGLLRSGPGSSSSDSRSGKATRKAKQRQERQAEAAARAEQARQEQSELDLFEDEPLASPGPASAPSTEARAEEGEPRSQRARRGDAPRDEPSSAGEEEAVSSANKNVDPDYSEVLVINVMAPPDQLIHGDELLPVLLGAGLRFGEMNIFHRHAHGKSGPVLFSVANVLNPGTFDLNEMHDFATRGLCFFLTLPNAINNMQAFEHMLQTARQVCDALDAELKDDYRSVMTAQTIEHYRERIRAFELRQLRQQASRQ